MNPCSNMILYMLQILSKAHEALHKIYSPTSKINK
jgi:hypothetical protein